MKTSFLFLLIMLTQLMLYAQEFNTSTQKGVDLKKYETFTILKGDITTDKDRQIDKESFFNEFKKIVTHELEGRGYKFTEDTTAQLSVSYVVETSRVMKVENLGPLGQMPASNSGDQQSSHWSREFERGVLIIDIEAGEDNSVWTAEGTMDVGRVQGVSIIEYSIKNAFAKFPDKKARNRKRNKKG